MKPADQSKLLADVEAFCQEIRPIEELCYVEYRFNDQVLPLARKHNLLGMPVPPEYGGRAGAIVTFAYPKNATGKDRRVSAFILDTDLEGFEAESFAPQAKMGMPTADTAMFSMRDCLVPAANLLGEEGNGFRIAMGTLVSGRLSVASGCLGVIEDCLTEVVRYATQERVQHGKLIGKHQLIQEPIPPNQMDRP